jgi:hypothetical protein
MPNRDCWDGSDAGLRLDAGGHLDVGMHVDVDWVLGTIFELGSSRMPLEGGSF